MVQEIFLHHFSLLLCEFFSTRNAFLAMTCSNFQAFVICKVFLYFVFFESASKENKICLFVCRCASECICFMSVSALLCLCVLSNDRGVPHLHFFLFTGIKCYLSIYLFYMYVCMYIYHNVLLAQYL